MIMNYDNIANRWERRSLGLGREERTAMQASDLLVSFAKSSQSSSTKFNSKSSSLSKFESSSSKSELPKSKASTMLLAHPGNAHPQ